MHVTRSRAIIIFLFSWTHSFWYPTETIPSCICCWTDRTNWNNWIPLLFSTIMSAEKSCVLSTLDCFFFKWNAVRMQILTSIDSLELKAAQASGPQIRLANYQPIAPHTKLQYSSEILFLLPPTHRGKVRCEVRDRGVLDSLVKFRLREGTNVYIDPSI